MSEVTIVGCGDIGRRVGHRLIASGIRVTAVVHQSEKVESLCNEGFTPLVCNLDFPEDLPRIPLHKRQVYYLVPPQGGGKSDYRMLNFCRQLSRDNCPARLVYISTSGVYGDCGEILVTEQTPVNPQTARAKRRASAEEQLREQARQLDFDLIILRVTGIYGPGRLPIARLLQGFPVLQAGEGACTNRIHTYDLVNVCLAAMDRGENGDVFNVCDGERTTMSDYFIAVARFAGLPQPRQITLAEAEREMNPLMLSYLKESRQMDNRLMREKLGVELMYPNLEAGLAVCEKEKI